MPVCLSASLIIVQNKINRICVFQQSTWASDFEVNSPMWQDFKAKQDLVLVLLICKIHYYKVIKYKY